jgi:hypothetical protein
MPSRRVQLEPPAPPLIIGALMPDPTAKGSKRPLELSPPGIVKRQLTGTAPVPSAAAPCAVGCVRVAGHVGLCCTRDGAMMPPNIKRAHATAKHERPVELDLWGEVDIDKEVPQSAPHPPPHGA